MRIFKAFAFEAAHRLPNTPDGHKCKRLHGHSFRVEIHVDGIMGLDSGWVVDFGDLKEAWRPLHDTLDHRYLNEVEGLKNPTSEVLARWIFERLVDRVGQLGPAEARLRLVEVRVQETCTSGAIYRPAAPG